MKKKPESDLVKKVTGSKAQKPGKHPALIISYIGKRPIKYKKTRVSRATKTEVDEYVRNHTPFSDSLAWAIEEEKSLDRAAEKAGLPKSTDRVQFDRFDLNNWKIFDASEPLVIPEAPNIHDRHLVVTAIGEIFLMWHSEQSEAWYLGQLYSRLSYLREDIEKDSLKTAAPRFWTYGRLAREYEIRFKTDKLFAAQNRIQGKRDDALNRVNKRKTETAKRWKMFIDDFLRLPHDESETSKKLAEIALENWNDANGQPPSVDQVRKYIGKQRGDT